MASTVHPELARRVYRKAPMLRVCLRCKGLNSNAPGYRPTDMDDGCPCWYRGAFHAALHAYRSLWREHSRPPGHVAIDYAADFERQARHVCLELGGIHPLVLETLYLQRQGWTAIYGRCGATGDQVYRAACRIERAVGRRLCELTPYPLYPMSNYSHAVVRPDLPTKNRYGTWRIQSADPEREMLCA